MTVIREIGNEAQPNDRTATVTGRGPADLAEKPSNPAVDSLFISVVVPTFNRSKIVMPVIESVLAQTYPAFEIIVVDDGSSDGTGEMLQRFIEHRYSSGHPTPQIRYFYQPNQGQSAARNRGIAEARGEWIAFLDSDDPWHPEKLEWQARAIAQFHDKCEACFTDARLTNNLSMDTTAFRSTGAQFDQPVGMFPEAADYLTRSINPSWLQTFVIRTDTIRRLGGFDRDLHFAEDQDFLFRLALATNYCYVNKPLVSIDRTDIHTDPAAGPRLWDSVEVRLHGRQQMYEKWLKLGPALSPDLRKSCIEKLRTIHSAQANLYLETGDYRKAREAMGTALKYQKTGALVVKWLLTCLAPKIARRLAPKSSTFFQA
jgi:glycosyltransferase involved in cell wall biosynthesis